MMSCIYLDSKLQIFVRNLNRFAIPETDSNKSLVRLRLSYHSTNKLFKARRKKSLRSNIDLNKQLLNLSKC
jgi:hypothetical protein